MTAPEWLAPEILDSSIRGQRLCGGTLRQEMGGRRTLLCFLRHLG